MSIVNSNTTCCGAHRTVVKNVVCQKDTLVVEHHVHVSQLHRCNFGGALIQTGHRCILVPVQAHHAVLQVQLILIAGHGQLCTDSGNTRKHQYWYNELTQNVTTHVNVQVTCWCQTCDCALSDLEDSVSDGSSRQQVDVIRGAQHDVLQNE